MVCIVNVMDLLDTVIHFRNKIQTLIPGVDDSLVLNSDGTETQIFVDEVILSSEIRQLMNRIRSLAIDPNNNRMDYLAVSKSEPYKEFRFLTNQLSYLDLNAINSIPDQLAFWINIYNSLIIDAVIQFGVELSITQGMFGIFSFFEQAAYRIGSHRFSLSDIEHGILRGNKGFPYLIGPHFNNNDPRKGWILPYVDPRIHFALNCASRSCPPINFYDPGKIKHQLNTASRNFINNNIAVNSEKRVLSISSIFRWYKSDFGGTKGIIEILSEHLHEGDLKFFIMKNRDSIRIKFQKYDWALNSV